ncbi:MAG: hypothetical protein WD960_13865 [Gemmatimonadota bacterium]
MKMRRRTATAPLMALFIAAGIVGCGGDTPPGEDAGAELGDRVDAATEAALSTSPSNETAEGEVSFEVDGVPYTFDHLPADETHYLAMGSAVVAKPGPDAVEQFRLTVMAIDLADLEFPADLPPSDRGESIRTAMMAIGFGFTNAQDEEWAGPGRLLVESFDGDGVLVATFSDVELPHTDKAQPPIMLTNGRIRVRFR